MNRSKVLVIGPSPYKSRGGMATVIMDIINDSELNKRFVIECHESYIDGNFIQRFLFSIYSYFSFVFRKSNYDIYHIHEASRGSAFRKAMYVNVIKRWNKRIILHVHGAEFLKFYNSLSEFRKRKLVRTLKMADLVLALSSSWKQEFDNIFKLTNCEVLENGIDVTKFEHAIQDEKLNSVEFIMLGRLGVRKGTYDLIDAIEMVSKTHKNIKLYLAGDGETENVKSIINSKGLQNNIEVVGWISDNDKIELLKKTSCLVLPSYDEGLPMAILEGMASGKAIISTSVGAIPEVVGAENGIVITPGDTKALANAISYYHENMALVWQIGQNNILKISEQFSLEKMHNKLMEYYLCCLERKL